MSQPWRLQRGENSLGWSSSRRFLRRQIGLAVKDGQGWNRQTAVEMKFPGEERAGAKVGRLERRRPIQRAMRKH